jgi:hypothetical protein
MNGEPGRAGPVHLERVAGAKPEPLAEETAAGLRDRRRVITGTTPDEEVRREARASRGIAVRLRGLPTRKE